MRETARRKQQTAGECIVLKAVRSICPSLRSQLAKRLTSAIQRGDA